MMFTLETAHPVALDSPDHLQPRSTAFDNSKNKNFNRALYKLFPPGYGVSVLDFGCSGGGMVKTILDDGHIAVGLEGSDYSKLHQRAEWATIPGNLFTCDVTKPFSLYCDGVSCQFDVITAWEFLEHIRREDLPQLFRNMHKHLKEGGLVIGSACKHPSIHKGVEHHQTRVPLRTWLGWFKENGFRQRPDLEKHFEGRWVRAVQYNFVFQEAESAE